MKKVQRKKWRTREPEIPFPNQPRDSQVIPKKGKSLISNGEKSKSQHKLSTSPSEKPQWVEGVYIIPVKTGDKRQIKAMIAQEIIAVHREIIDREEWTIACVKAGLQIVRVKTKEDAYRCGELLLKYGKVAFKQKTKEQIQLYLIQWLVDWIHAVKKEKGWVPTRPFKRQYNEEQ